MAIEVRCDVDGCDSHAPLPLVSGALMGMPMEVAPKGWTMVLVPPTEVDQQRFKNKMEERFAGVAQGPSGPLGSLVARKMANMPVPPRRAFCCDKHEMPKFRPAMEVPDDFEY